MSKYFWRNRLCESAIYIRMFPVSMECVHHIARSACIQVSELALCYRHSLYKGVCYESSVDCLGETRCVFQIRRLAACLSNRNRANKGVYRTLKPVNAFGKKIPVTTTISPGHSKGSTLLILGWIEYNSLMKGSTWNLVSPKRYHPTPLFWSSCPSLARL